MILRSIEDTHRDGESTIDDRVTIRVEVDEGTAGRGWARFKVQGISGRRSPVAGGASLALFAFRFWFSLFWFSIFLPGHAYT